MQPDSDTGSVFITYSHDSEEHASQVLAFAKRLRADGFRVVLDQDLRSRPEEGWAKWMDRQLREADAVVIVSSEGYRRKLEHNIGDDSEPGLGVAFESTLIWDEIHAARARNTRFFPVVFTDSESTVVPGPLRIAGVYRVYAGTGYSELCDRLRERHAVKNPEDDSPPAKFVKMQISEIITEKLREASVDVDDLPSDWDLTSDDLVNYCATATHGMSREELKSRIDGARGFAFDIKYADQDYTDNYRGFTDAWRSEIREILRSLKADDYLSRRLVSVGIGNGLEAEGLFDNARILTAVDLAPRSLQIAKRRLRYARTVNAQAEHLKGILNASHDIYLSFRTYQSSYFDVSRALREAYRVVRPGGLILISVANGYISEGGFIPGMLIPRSTVVDRDRPFELVDKIRRKLTLLRFEEIGIRTGFGEVFVYGRRGR